MFSTMHSSTIRVLLMTSTRTLARGFEVFASEHEGLQAAVCTASPDFWAVAEQWNPSVVLLDTALQVDFTLIRALRDRVPQCRVVLWTPSLSVEVAHQARSAGVHGVLYKDAAD